MKMCEKQTNFDHEEIAIQTTRNHEVKFDAPRNANFTPLNYTRSALHEVHFIPCIVRIFEKYLKIFEILSNYFKLN